MSYVPPNQSYELSQQQRNALSELRVAQTHFEHARIGRISAITIARENGLTWQHIGDELGISSHEAREQFRRYL